MGFRMMSQGKRLQRIKTEGSKTWKIALCPICRREDMCSKDAELVSCWYCTQMGCQGRPRKKAAGEIDPTDSGVKVSKSDKPTSDKSARRFAALAAEQMLPHVGSANAAFIERAFYELALQDMLACGELDGETRIQRDFPHTYHDKYDGGEKKTAHCSPSYALKLSLGRENYPGSCINKHTRELYETARARLLPEGTNDRNAKSKPRSRKRRYDRERRTRTTRNRRQRA